MKTVDAGSLLLATTSAEAGITRWADITCWEGVSTRDNKTFTRYRPKPGIGRAQELTFEKGKVAILSFFDRR